MEYNFEYDQKDNVIETEWALCVECEIKYINREEFNVDIKVYSYGTNEDIYDKLSLLDKAAIGKRAYNPPSKILSDAYQDYESSRQPQYDKYAGF